MTQQTDRAFFCDRDCRESWHIGGNYGSYVCRNPEHHKKKETDMRPKQNYEVHRAENGHVKMWTKGVPVALNALDQLDNLANLPFIFKHVAAMPDVHWGMGSTIGSVIPTQGAVIPAAVGVDIGCGMCACRTNLTYDDIEGKLPGIRARIESYIPHGRENHGEVGNDTGGWDPGAGAQTLAFEAARVWDTELRDDYEEIADYHPKLRGRGGKGATWTHLGTLGSGNHFVEVTVDRENKVWVFLHSGSRGPGARIGNVYMRLAKELMEKFHIKLSDPNLAYFPQGRGNHFGEYMRAVNWAQRFAKTSRRIMRTNALCALADELGREVATDLSIDCHHNYVAQERHFGETVLVTRKGATRAGKGEWGLIPGSMGAKSYVVKGLGNRDSFESCSHGAGRVMGRKMAMRTLTVEQHIADTDGVECRKDEGVLDESPACYKDIDDVMRAQADLVEPIYTLKAVVCIKG